MFTVENDSSCLNVSNYLLEVAPEHGLELTKLQLIKLTYIVYGWVLAALKHKLFDDQIQAWRDGPVIPKLYYQYHYIGRDGLISDPASHVERKEFSDKIKNIVSVVLEAYKGFSGDELSELTHAKNTPWSKCYTTNCNVLIEDSEIYSHYREVIKRLFEQK